MVVTNIFAAFRVVTGTAAVSVLVLANPAHANSSAAADIAAPLRAAQTAKQSVSGTDDEQFKTLFKSWRNFEETGVPALAAVAEAAGQAGLTASSRAAVASITQAVSIPSRAPLGNMQLTSGYGMRVHPVLGQRRGHKGIDLGAPTGTPIHATADGIVSRADNFGSYGLYVALEHGGEIQTRYAHMSRLNVAEGQRVKKGEVIGFVGSTGRSTGPHLHYEVRVRGEAVNPIPYMSAPPATLAANAAGMGQGGPE